MQKWDNFSGFCNITFLLLYKQKTGNDTILHKIITFLLLSKSLLSKRKVMFLCSDITCLLLHRHITFLYFFWSKRKVMCLWNKRKVMDSTTFAIIKSKLISFIVDVKWNVMQLLAIWKAGNVNYWTLVVW